MLDRREGGEPEGLDWLRRATGAMAMMGFAASP